MIFFLGFQAIDKIHEKIDNPIKYFNPNKINIL